MADFKKARKDGYRVTKIAVKSIEHKDLKKHIGILSIKGHRKLEGTQLEEIGDTISSRFKHFLSRQIYDKCPFDDKQKNHHVALMRDTELVIKYMEGELPENEQYSGVFITDRDKFVDEAFADSEPAAHDNWEPAGLTGDKQRLVKHCLTQLKKLMKEFSGVENVKSSVSADNKPLTLLSRDLSNLIPNISSIGASRKVRKLHN